MNDDKTKADSLDRAENALRLRDFETAERLARKSLMANPTFSKPRLILGTVYLRTNRANEALAAFSSAVEVNAKDVRALEGMAIAYLRLKRPKDALSALEHAIAHAPHDSELMFNLGKCQGREFSKTCFVALKFR